MEKKKIMMGATYEKFMNSDLVEVDLQEMASLFCKTNDHIMFDTSDLTFYVWNEQDGSRLDQTLLIMLYGECQLRITINVAC